MKLPADNSPAWHRHCADLFARVYARAGMADDPEAQRVVALQLSLAAKAAESVRALKKQERDAPATSPTAN